MVIYCCFVKSVRLVNHRPGWGPDRNTSQDLFHDPFVLLSYVSAAAPKLALSTGVLIMAQRQTALIAKQAACLDVLCKGRFRRRNRFWSPKWCVSR
jgi:alkanesulfonate monooxygenase SsuD/methylene tetrahydromethanopterin reductase-like flavin-dependent oxidoreductase (luciferase family)